MTDGSLPDLDERIHQRTRLGILTVLVEAGATSFTFLRDSLGLTDGNLSRHLRVLEEGGLVSIKKGFRGRTPHTTVQATIRGREAFDEYLVSLEDMITRIRTTGPGRGAE